MGNCNYINISLFTSLSVLIIAVAFLWSLQASLEAQFWTALISIFASEMSQCDTVVSEWSSVYEWVIITVCVALVSVQSFNVNIDKCIDDCGRIWLLLGVWFFFFFFFFFFILLRMLHSLNCNCAPVKILLIGKLCCSLGGYIVFPLKTLNAYVDVFAVDFNIHIH